MNRQVLKYPFMHTSPLVAPVGKVVLVDYQSDNSEMPTLWIEHAPGAPMATYVMVGTGHPIASHMEHVGSAICGRFVWHVYRIG